MAMTNWKQFIVLGNQHKSILYAHLYITVYYCYNIAICMQNGYIIILSQRCCHNYQVFFLYLRIQDDIYLMQLVFYCRFIISHTLIQCFQEQIFCFHTVLACISKVFVAHTIMTLMDYLGWWAFDILETVGEVGVYEMTRVTSARD
jgi:hypothetical protein